MPEKKRIIDAFKYEYQKRAAVYVESPGRIEIIGNHTDHNGGVAIVSTINLAIKGTASVNSSNKWRILSKEAGRIEVDLTKLIVEEKEKRTAIAFLKGIATECIQRKIAIGGLDAIIESTIPMGSGLSSSAAFTSLFVELVNYFYNNRTIDKQVLVDIAHKAETIYFGKACGRLDQTAILYGGLNLLDFKKPTEVRVTPLDAIFDPYQMVIAHTGKDHQSLVGLYDEIPKEMNKVAKYFGKNRLIELQKENVLDHFSNLREKLSDRAVLRSLHFFDENNRVLQAARALEFDQMALFFELIKASNYSSLEYLQNHYVPNSTSQGILAALALTKEYAVDGTYRLHGGGFEGTILVFLHHKEVNRYVSKMKKAFGEKNVVVLEARDKGVTIEEI